MINHIAVIGGGTMGRGIAYTAALAGFEVALQDISEEALGRAREYIETLLDKQPWLSATPWDENPVPAYNKNFATTLANSKSSTRNTSSLMVV